MTTAVYCIANSEAQAGRIVSDLRAAGFSSDDISALFPDQHGSRDFAHEQNTKAPEGATTGGVVGGLLGGTLGWLVGAGSLLIPGVGPFIAAGPIMAALGGAALVGSAGGIVGALVGMGIPEIEAKRYAGKLSDGNILISVHCHDSEDKTRAKDIFQHADALDISTAGESSPPKRKRRS